MLNVAVIGTGDVGLVTGTCLSELGHSVVCVDTDAGKRRKKSRSIEPGLQELVASSADHGRLRFESDIAEAVAGGVRVLVISARPRRAATAAPTSNMCIVPPKTWGHALAALPASLRRFTAIVTKSTVPLGDQLGGGRHQSQSRQRFATASSPMREGNAIEDFMHRIGS